MQKRYKYTPISTVVKEITASIEDASHSSELKVARLIGPAIREMSYNLSASFRTVRVAVQSNGTAPMPDDTIRPVKAFIERTAGGSTVIFQLGNMELYDGELPSSLSCDDIEPLPASSATITLPNFYNSPEHPFSFFNPYFSEQYGRRDTRFFGFWGYRATENQVEFSGVGTGESVIVVYESSAEVSKLVADVAIPVIRARVLQQYFEATNPSKSQYYHAELRRARAAYKRYKLSGVSYEDYLDWVTSSYSNEPR